jgi:hypothetical protein
MKYVTSEGIWMDTPSALIGYVVREDSRVERVCAHGVGHPVGHLVRWESWMSMHGCDGCCSQWTERSVDRT